MICAACGEEYRAAYSNGCPVCHHGREIKQRGMAEEWKDEAFDLTGYEVGVRRLWTDENGQAGVDLPLKMTAATVGELRDGLRVLCLKGGPCWPGEVKPLQDGQSYGVWFHPTGEIDKARWMVVVGCPEGKEQNRLNQPERKSDPKRK